MKFRKKKEEKSKEGQAKEPKVKRTYTTKFYMMVFSVVAFIIGIILFILYVGSLNMVLGAPGVIMAVVSIFIFRYYWKKEENISVEHIGGEKKDDSANSLNIYPGKVEFANVNDPKGFPMKCINLGKKFYVNIWDEATKRLVPFVLPDQQYLDPEYLAQRILELPAHRKIFARKPQLMQKLKTALLVAAIGIVWLLILTTTGEA